MNCQKIRSLLLGVFKHQTFRRQRCRDAIHRGFKQLIYADLIRFFQKNKFIIVESDSPTS